MKILIATPIHESKDYAVLRWLEGVARLQRVYPADLLIVDNSLTPGYEEKVRDYCRRLRVKNYTVEHIDLPASQERFERMARSREVIRRKFLAQDYDAWFSWESDIVIPPDALDRLTQLMQSGDFMVVEHQCWMRGYLGAYCTDFGLALVAREALKRYSFILNFGTDVEMPQTYEPSEAWFKKRIIRDGGGCIEVDNVIYPIVHLHVPANIKPWKILIGTPIHQSKDYAMDRWLENVSRLEYPTDLFLVDNSPGTEYVEKVKGYLAKYGITNYQIKHVELAEAVDKWERIARSREIIRQYLLSHDYDAWFTWECDQIIPVNTLAELIQIAQSENYMMVNPNKWARENPDLINTDFGCCLIQRQVLAKYSFLLDFDADPDIPATYEPSEAWFKSRVLRGGDSYVDVCGVIKPIYHLNQ